MLHDHGKDPPARAGRGSPRPLARWALAIALADLALIAGIVRVPAALDLGVEPYRPPPGARMTRARVTADRAVFLWRSGVGGHAVVLASHGAPVVRALDAAHWESALSDPCGALAIGPTASCAPAATAARTVLEGGEASGAVTVQARWEGLTLTARRGFRVERPWIALGSRRVSVTRDVRVEDLVRVGVRAGSAGWLAGPRGERLVLAPAGDGLLGARVSALARITGRLGMDGLALAAGLWLCAQTIALAAARSDGSSVFWRRFLRWSALLATAVTGGLALAAHQFADGG
jgi:hypothetical protein